MEGSSSEADPPIWTEASLRERHQAEVQKCRKLESQLALLKRKLELTIKEKENVITQLSKVAATRAKMESLCRTLQKQIRMIQEESALRAKQDEEQRTSLEAKFRANVEEMKARVGGDNEQKAELLRFKDRMKEKVEQTHQTVLMMEDAYKQEWKRVELQAHLAQLKLQQQQILLKEMEMMRNKRNEFIDAKKKESSLLEEELLSCGGRLTQLLEQINGSNKNFGRFHGDLKTGLESRVALQAEIDRMQCLCSRAEAAKKTLKPKLEKFEKRIPQLQKQNERLSSLCTVLQKEVDELLGKHSSTPG
eukprot:RCo029024